MEPTLTRFEGFEGIHLVADVWGDPDAWPVLLMHGGGQTRHAWGSTAQTLAANGWRAVSLDLRGHGDSEWALNGDYSFTAFANDAIAVADQLGKPPVFVGASLGGVGAIIAEGGSDRVVSSALVVVDITHRSNPEGIQRIKDFMSSGLERLRHSRRRGRGDRGVHAEPAQAGEPGRADEGAAPEARRALVLALGPRVHRPRSRTEVPAADFQSAVRGRARAASGCRRCSCAGKLSDVVTDEGHPGVPREDPGLEARRRGRRVAHGRRRPERHVLRRGRRVPRERRAPHPSGRASEATMRIGMYRGRRVERSDRQGGRRRARRRRRRVTCRSGCPRRWASTR